MAVSKWNKRSRSWNHNAPEVKASRLSGKEVGSNKDKPRNERNWMLKNGDRVAQRSVLCKYFYTLNVQFNFFSACWKLESKTQVFPLICHYISFGVQISRRLSSPFPNSPVWRLWTSPFNYFLTGTDRYKLPTGFEERFINPTSGNYFWTYVRVNESQAGRHVLFANITELSCDR